MLQHVVFGGVLLVASVSALQPGTLVPEVHPLLTTQKCTLAGGCITNPETSVVIDDYYRTIHGDNGKLCVDKEGVFNTDICPDVETCAVNCFVEGVDYAAAGVSTDGNALTMNLFSTKNNKTTVVTPRVYLLADDNNYEMFKLLNQEFTFDVDVSKVPCGVNGALYLADMDSTGSFNDFNQAGAAYGTGYCDAQCYTQNWINGEANLNKTFGACCQELDIWEANSASTLLGAHPCNTTGVYACTGVECGNGADYFNGVCDKPGCDFNPYRVGQTDFYGPSLTVDTTKPFTVVTQFITDDNTDTGTLTAIRRLYVQDGQVISNAVVNVTGITPTDTMTDEYCKENKAAFGNPDAFTPRGGLKTQGEALGRGQVLAMSVWQDSYSGMQWLDSQWLEGKPVGTPGTVRGTCAEGSGDPAFLIKTYPDAAVVFSNIKSGEIGSTFQTA